MVWPPPRRPPGTWEVGTADSGTGSLSGSPLPPWSSTRTGHRHQPGYVFTWDVLTETNPRRAAAALRRRGVGALVLCGSDQTTGFFPVRAVNGSFLEYLAGGGVPDGYALHAAKPYWRVYRRDDASDTLAP
jgi:hypothetical protein